MRGGDLHGREGERERGTTVAVESERRGVKRRSGDVVRDLLELHFSGPVGSWYLLRQVS